MAADNSVNFMLRSNAIEQSMRGLDDQLRQHQVDRQNMVIEAIQNNALEMQQAAVRRQQTMIGSIVNTYA